MAESDKTNSLSQDYLLKDIEEKLNVDTESADKSAEKDVVTTAPAESPATENSVESSDNSAAGENVTESGDSSQGSDTAAEENVVETEKSETDAPAEESSETAEEGNTDEEKPEIKLETAPGDYRFPTTNQSRHCFTRYVEYHRCVAAKGEDASECDKFAKYYRSLCPGEWVDRWNEQRENGTFPGPL